MLPNSRLDDRYVCRLEMSQNLVVVDHPHAKISIINCLSIAVALVLYQLWEPADIG